MNGDVHLTELEVYEAALDAQSSGDRAEHIAGCIRCAAAVEETRSLLDSLEAIGPESNVPGELEDRLMRRIRMASSELTKPGHAVGKPGIRSWLLRAAAALILFASGVATHSVWSGSDAPGSAIVAPPPAPGPTLALQKAGTEYVSAIARLVADSSRLSEAERRRGQEVAFAAMSGAAFELRLLTNDSEEAADIHRVASRARFPENVPDSP